ncbi:MAG TPA: hypothetical protein V6C46_06895, partial [Coleofasciculaceae cyanobacterium]
MTKLELRNLPEKLELRGVALPSWSLVTRLLEAPASQGGYEAPASSSGNVIFINASFPVKADHIGDT